MDEEDQKNLQIKRIVEQLQNLVERITHVSELEGNIKDTLIQETYKIKEQVVSLAKEVYTSKEQIKAHEEVIQKIQNTLCSASCKYSNYFEDLVKKDFDECQRMLDEEDWNDALNGFEKILKTYPQDMEALDGAAQAALNLGFYNKVLGYFNTILEIDKNYEHIIYHKADLLVVMNNTKEAHQTLVSIPEEQREECFNDHLGPIIYYLDDEDLYLEFMKKSETDIHLNTIGTRSLLLNKYSNNDLAKKELRRIKFSELKEDDEISAFFLLKLQLKDYESVDEILQFIIKEEPQDFLIYNLAFYLAKAVKNKTFLMKIHKIGQKKFPDNSFFYFAESELLVSEKRYDEFLKTLYKAVDNVQCLGCREIFFTKLIENLNSYNEEQFDQFMIENLEKNLDKCEDLGFISIYLFISIRHNHELDFEKVKNCIDIQSKNDSKYMIRFIAWLLFKSKIDLDYSEHLFKSLLDNKQDIVSQMMIRNYLGCLFIEKEQFEDAIIEYLTIVKSDLYQLPITEDCVVKLIDSGYLKNNDLVIIQDALSKIPRRESTT